MGVDGAVALLGQRIDVFRRGPEQGHCLGIGEIEQDVAVGIEGRAVVEQQRRLRRQGRDQPVPHHPAAGGEIEHPVVAADVAMQPLFLQMLQQGAAGPVHDAFRHAGGAAGKHDVERRVEIVAVEVDIAGRERRDVVAQHHAVAHPADRRPFADIGYKDGAPDGRQGGLDLRQLIQPVQGLAVVEIAVGREQHLGLDLSETVEHPLHAEIRRGRGPHRSQRRGGQHGDDRFRHVRHIAGDPVARPHPLGLQGLRQPADGVVELGMAQPPAYLVLAPEHDGVAVVAAAQQVLGVVQPGIGKEAGAGHLAAIGEHPVAAGLRDHAALVPDGGPEFLHMGDRPIVERRVIGQVDPVPGRHAVLEDGQIGGGDPVRRRRPQRRGHSAGSFGCPADGSIGKIWANLANRARHATIMSP